MPALLRAAVFVGLVLLIAQAGSADVTPITNVSNDYFTPAKTFTPATTFSSVVDGQVTTITDQGPTQLPGSYTFTYTKPKSTVSAPESSALMKSLSEKGNVPEASQLQADPGALQTAHGVGLGDDGIISKSLPLSSVLVALIAVFSGAILL
jgi:hypothetical protein